jgi:hypothetical protein
MSNPLKRIPRELREMVADAISRGWVLDDRKTKSCHTKLRHPSGKFVIVSASPSSSQVRKMLDSDIRRIERASP